MSEDQPRRFSGLPFPRLLSSDRTPQSFGTRTVVLTENTETTAVFARNALPWYKRLCTKAVRICSLVVVSVLFMLAILATSAILSSYFLGLDSYQSESLAQAAFYARVVEAYVQGGADTVDSLASVPDIRRVVCDNSSDTTSAEVFLQNAATSMQHVWPHHVRVVGIDGDEIVRIDVEHDQSNSISTTLYNVSERPYHEYFVTEISTSCDDPDRVKVFPWNTHGPLPNGSDYSYSGDDPFGDHHLDHIEYFPLPSLMKLQKPIRCSYPNGSVKMREDDSSCPLSSPGYVILNLRMVYVLGEISSLINTDKGHVVILDPEGNYIFNSDNRDREFEGHLLANHDESIHGPYINSLERDYGYGTLEKMFSSSSSSSEIDFIITRNSKGVEMSRCQVYRIGFFSDFVCCVIRNDPSWHNVEGKRKDDRFYHVCNVHSVFLAFSTSPTPLFAFLVVLVVLPSIVAFVGVILWRRALSASRRAQTLMELLYPSHVRKRLLRGELIRPRKEQSLGIHFGDIVQFCKTTETFSPRAIVAWLGSVMHVVDIFASYYSVHKVKSIGDAVFCVSNLGGRQRGRKKVHLCKLIEFALLLRYFFDTREMLLHSSEIHDDDESDSEIEEMAFGSQTKRNKKRKKRRKRKRGHSPMETPRESTMTGAAKTRIFPLVQESLPVLHYDDISAQIQRKDFPWDEGEFLVQMPSLLWRQGIHLGAAVSGVFERGSPVFDLFGNAINFASRLESTCPHGEVQTSEAVKTAIRGSRELTVSKLVFAHRGQIEMKGFGFVSCFCVNEKERGSFNFERVIEIAGLNQPTSPFRNLAMRVEDNGTGVASPVNVTKVEKLGGLELDDDLDHSIGGSSSSSSDGVTPVIGLDECSSSDNSSASSSDDPGMKSFSLVGFRRGLVREH